MTSLPVTLARHAHETTTFRLVVDGPLPAAVLAAPLTLKVALDQVNPASRSADTLAYAKVTVHLEKPKPAKKKK